MDRIEKLKAYLEKSPADSFLRHALGLEYLKTGDDAAAKTEFEKVIELDPTYVGTYYHLAKLLEKIGELDRAVNIYEKGVEAAKTAGDNHARNELQAALDAMD